MNPPSPLAPDEEAAEVRAAGAVLWRDSGGTEVALVHRPRYDDWSFPKGKLDGDESLPVAAVREVVEETGYTARLGAIVHDVRYAVPEGRKTVRYWAAEARSGGFAPNAETDELRWLTVERAADLLSYRHDVDVLRRFSAVAPPASVIALVRHAKAGSRSQWDGDDAMRPLSGSGRDQAKHLAELLVLFGPDRILSAPPVRCRDTVAPLAAALSLPIPDEPLLGETDYWENPPAGLARLREIAAQPGVTVVCSQGGVIPDVVGTLVSGRGLPGVDPDDVRARKTSTWVLTFDAEVALRSADYYPYPTG